MLRDIVLIMLIITDLYFLALFKIQKNIMDINHVLICKLINQYEKKEPKNEI